LEHELWPISAHPFVLRFRRFDLATKQVVITLCVAYEFMGTRTINDQRECNLLEKICMVKNRFLSHTNIKYIRGYENYHVFSGIDNLMPFDLELCSGGMMKSTTLLVIFFHYALF
jgi:hypothetical protein